MDEQMTETMAESMTEGCIDGKRRVVSGGRWQDASTQSSTQASMQSSIQPSAIRHLSSAIDSAIRTLTG